MSVLVMVCALACVLPLVTMTTAARANGATHKAVLRIPTGGRESARLAVRELDRAGFRSHFDHARTFHRVEMALERAVLARIMDTGRSPLRFSQLSDRAEWVVVRNLTASQRGVPVVPQSAPPGPGSLRPSPYLPVDHRRYHSSDEFQHIMRAFAHFHSNHTSIHNLGQTRRGGIIWALKISGLSQTGAITQKPAVLLTGSPHGDDRLGREMCLWVAEHLCRKYDQDASIRSMMDHLDVYLLPDPSPDASLIGSRYTSHGVDLDRSFPDRVAHRSDPITPIPEVSALTEWAAQQRFVASASFLGGGGGPGYQGTVIRYPWSSSPRRATEVYRSERTPDDRLLRYLARLYAQAHPTMAARDPRGANSPDAGTVNGAEWYPRYGSMQDWIYEVTGSLHLDLVVSPYLRPLPQSLPGYWTQNSGAIMAMLKEVGRAGLRGRVTDARGSGIPGAKVLIRDMTNRGKRIHATSGHPETGEFSRYLVPGRYMVWADAPGYHTASEHTFRINQRKPLHRIDIVLSMQGTD